MRLVVPICAISALLIAAGCSETDDPSTSSDRPPGGDRSAASTEVATWTGSVDGEEPAGWTVKVGDVECGISLTVPEDAWTEEYADREGEIIKAPPGTQYCLVQVDATNKSTKPQPKAPVPGNVDLGGREFAPDYDLDIFLAGFYEAADATGYFVDEPVQPGATTKTFQLYGLDDGEKIQAVMISEDDPKVKLSVN